jgi:hypothetical protein
MGRLYWADMAQSPRQSEVLFRCVSRPRMAVETEPT